MGLCFKYWYLPRDPYLKKNSIYLLCSNEKKTAFTSFASKIGIYLGTPTFKKTAFTSFAQMKKKQHLPPLLPKLVFTPGPLLLKKQHLPPLLKRRNSIYLLCFQNWYLPRDHYFEKNSIYLLCSNEKKQHLPPLLPKLVFTSGPLLLKKQHLPPLLKRKKKSIYLLCFQNWYLPRDPYF